LVALNSDNALQLNTLWLILVIGRGTVLVILGYVKISSISAEWLLSITFMSLLEWIRFCSPELGAEQNLLTS
jgi:hypothetical protein